MQLLNDQNILYKKQLGFQTNFSTVHTIISLIHRNEMPMDNNLFVCRILTDSQKAFDTVNHSTLLDKISHYGIRDLANSWFSSYLSNRTQFVTINGFTATQSIRYGVPHGSILFPLLFLIYINDLYNAIRFSEPLQSADDTCLLNIQRKISKINKSLNKDLKELQFG